MKQASRKSKFYLGAFTVLMTVLIGLAILFAGQDLTLFKSRTKYLVLFKNTTGLQAGAPLKMGGVDIGNVESIAITNDNGFPQILATLVVYSPNDLLIKTDSDAALETQGMLGDKFLNITPGSSSAERLPAGHFIKPNEKLGLSGVVAKSTDIVESVGKAMTKLDTMASALPDQKAVKDMAAEMRDSIKEMHGFLKTLNSEDSALRLLSDKATAAKMDRTINSLQSAAQHFESVAKKIDEGQGTLGSLVNDASLYDDMRTLMGRANRSKAMRFIIQETLKESAGAK